MPDFLFATCQIGAEKALKGELTRRWPSFRLAFSRPGFLTFKLPPGHAVADDFELDVVFARAYGLSLGPVRGRNLAELAAAAWEIGGGQTFQRVHVWERDARAPGVHGFEPTLTPSAVEAHRLIVQHCPKPQCLAGTAANPFRSARPGELVLDCVLLNPAPATSPAASDRSANSTETAVVATEPEASAVAAPCQWWVGYHRAKSVPSRQPGGLFSIELPADAVSRAWLKTEEALRWSRLPIPRGARVAEIGSAPGGSSQCLLSHGFLVTGIDPAAMSPVVLENPHFTHIRCRSPQVRRREFRKIRWLTADMNVAPQYTLDAVEGIVTHPQVNVRGLLLTLKLPEWELSQRIPEYLDRIRSWGYNLVRARQLQYNRREICVAALRQPFRRK